MSTSPAVLGGGAPLRAADKAALTGEIIAAYVRARRLVRRGDLRATLHVLRAAAALEAAPDGPTAQAAGLRMARVVNRVLPRLPADSRCLMRSLVLTSLLARRGLESSLIIGVRPGSRFGAHAWVELGGLPLLPPREDEFERLVAL